MDGGGRDRWDGYPKERGEILRFINARKIPGVVFLSADLHYAAITKIRNGGGLRDVAAGPLGAPLNGLLTGRAAGSNFFRRKISISPRLRLIPKPRRSMRWSNSSTRTTRLSIVRKSTPAEGVYTGPKFRAIVRSYRVEPPAKWGVGWRCLSQILKSGMLMGLAK